VSELRQAQREISYYFVMLADQATPVSRARADANRLRDDLQSKIDYLRTQIREIAAALRRADTLQH
jgi:hypothetical protein